MQENSHCIFYSDSVCQIPFTDKYTSRSGLPLFQNESLTKVPSIYMEMSLHLNEPAGGIHCHMNQSFAERLVLTERQMAKSEMAFNYAIYYMRT